MNKREIDKLRLFVGGLKNRYEENTDLFIGLEIEWSSGRKKFTASYDGSKDRLYYNKEYLSLDLNKALDFLTEETIKYDAMMMRYNERGTTVTVFADGKNVTIRQEAKEKVPTVAEPSGRSYYIKASQAKELLQEIDILTQDGKLKNDKIRKYNQIDHFIEVVDPIIQSLPKDRSITILDCACGKSYLTFVLNFYLVEVLKRKCHIIGVDYNEDVIASSIKRAERLGYRNMEFIRADLNAFEPDRSVDLLVSLHACDNATDYAIAAGIRLNVPAMVVVPCCHKEFIDQLKNEEMAPILRHNIFKARFNDMFTDAFRSLYLESRGYEVSPLEYISPLDTPKNIMIRAMKKKDGDPAAREEYRRIKKLFGVDPILEKL